MKSGVNESWVVHTSRAKRSLGAACTKERGDSNTPAIARSARLCRRFFLLPGRYELRASADRPFHKRFKFSEGKR